MAEFRCPHCELEIAQGEVHMKADCAHPELWAVTVGTDQFGGAVLRETIAIEPPDPSEEA